MKKRSDTGCLVIDTGLHGKDMKNYKATEKVHVFKLGSWLFIASLIAVLAWMGERDQQAKIEQVRLAPQCGVES